MKKNIYITKKYSLCPESKKRRFPDEISAKLFLLKLDKKTGGNKVSIISLVIKDQLEYINVISAMVFI